MSQAFTWLLLFLVVSAAVMEVAEAAGGPDYYAILGVPRSASQPEIRSAYKKLAAKFHPDKAKTDADRDEYQKKFIDIGKAYHVLSDEHQKTIYDQYGEEGINQQGAGGPGGPGANFNPFEMFNSFFGGGGGMGGGNVHFTFSTNGGPQQQWGGFGGGGGGDEFNFGGFGQQGFGGGGGRRYQQQQQQQVEDLYEGSDVVRITSESEFRRRVLSPNEMWMVNFYSPDCGHCHNLAPVYKKLAKSLKNLVNVAAVNCKMSQQICGANGIQAYPTIKLFGYDAARVEEYSGERTLKNLDEWATSRIPDTVQPISSSNVAEFTKQTINKVRVILFTSKNHASPLIRTLSRSLRNVATFAIASDSDSSLTSLFGGLQKSPIIFVVQAGPDLSNYQKYNGAVSFTEMQEFINRMASFGRGEVHKKQPAPVHHGILEITKDTYSELISSPFAFIYFPPSGVLKSDAQAKLESLARHYKADNIHFFWADSTKLASWKAQFPEPEQQSLQSLEMLAVRPAKNRIAWAVGRFTGTSDLELFLDRVVGDRKSVV